MAVVPRRRFACLAAISALYSSSLSAMYLPMLIIMSSMDRLPNPFQFLGSALRGFLFELSYQPIARRIVFWRKAGDTVGLGELVGLIKFGSRTDIIVPHFVSLIVKKGDRVRGATTIIGRYDPEIAGRDKRINQASSAEPKL